MSSESVIQKQIRLAVCSSGRAMVTRCNTGLAVPLAELKRGSERPVRYGLGNGTPDLVGCLVPSGRVFCIEVKAEKGRVSPDQIAWAEACRARGGFVAVCRSVDEAMEAVCRAERGESK